MLWKLTRQEIIKAVLKIAIHRGLEVIKVYSLSSGLFVSVQLSNGHIVNIQDYEIQEVL